MKYLCQQQGEAACCLLVCDVGGTEKTTFLYLFGGGFEIVISIDCMN